MEAIFHKDGPAMVLAGPGSGKTFVIVERLRHLIEECSVDPSSVLVITFTKAAAIEMQHRFYKITNSLYPEVCFGTFHSVFYQIIRQSNPSNKLKIVSEKDKYRFIKDIILKLSVMHNIDKQESLDAIEMIGDIISEISRIKNTGADAREHLGSIPFSKHFEEIFREYNSLLTEFGMVDFDDMILKCYELLKRDKRALDTWSRRFEYVLIDEYQDINLMQYKVVRLLCASNNLFVVGDDDQSIYGFRGSDPGIMQKFTAEFEGHNPKIINLNINYRCAKRIIYASNILIKDNKIRLNKVLMPNETSPDGFVYPRRYIDKRQQSTAIIKFLSENMDKLDSIAFIFRTNSEAMALAGECKQFKIPTNLDEQAISFVETQGVRLCENYLKFVYEGKKREYFLKIMNNPNRYISRNALSKESVSEAELIKYYKGNHDRVKEIEKLFRQLNMLGHIRPSLSIRFLRNEIGIDKMFPKDTAALDELSELSKSIPDNRMLLKELEKIRENSVTEKKVVAKNKGKCVKLMTMHGSKGLEYDIVWLPGLNEGIIPSRSCVTNEQIEEERRMLYVGMTRAKSALIMSYLTGNKENPMMPSRFLRPIRHLWEGDHSSPSSPSSGSSTSSSNSTSSR